jgi:hypothetical protein
MRAVQVLLIAASVACANRERRTSGGWRIQKLQELEQLYLRRDGLAMNN